MRGEKKGCSTLQSSDDMDSGYCYQLLRELFVSRESMIRIRRIEKE